MPLAAGSRLGHDEIVSAIGAGGMGEVYRARDTSLKRDVAVKILPAPFAGDSERLARFQREAELLASLNHPNTAAIYGRAEDDGIKALPIAKQIAEALEAAHERGIIHRDLKSANIKHKVDLAARPARWRQPCTR